MILHSKFLTAIVLALLFSGCSGDSSEADHGAGSPEVTEPLVDRDLPEIRERGKLVALTGYNANSYFIYKGEPLGFEYELLKRLSDDLNVDLEVIPVRNLDRFISLLNQGKGDLIAYNLTVTKERRQKVAFTKSHTIIRQVLVQRLPENRRELKRHEIDQMLITNPIELIGKTIHVRKESSYYERLKNLSSEIGGDINVVEAPGHMTTEELIRLVAEGEIEYTVADENIALINQAYYDNIDVRTAISLPQRIAWAVRKNSPELKAHIDNWLAGLKRTPIFNVLYRKYYKNKRYFRRRLDSDYLAEEGGKISPFDDHIKKLASEINWDWRIIAAQVYQESKFETDARSWMGAKGLMQLMPRTAKKFDVDELGDPIDNLTAGTRYLEWLWNYWDDIPDSTERVKFVLASYNAGLGHVEDARRLAAKFDHDPDVWDDQVEKYILKKSHKEYFNDEVVYYGYCRGQEPVQYVEDILHRYEHYQNFID